MPIHSPLEILIPIVAILGAFGCPVLLSAVYYTFRAIQVGHEAALKREMVARGYTAQEIVQVIAAGTGSRFKPVTDAPPAKAIKPAHFEGIPAAN